MKEQSDRKRDKLTQNRLGDTIKQTMHLDMDMFKTEMDTLLNSSLITALQPAADKIPMFPMINMNAMASTPGTPSKQNDGNTNQKRKRDPKSQNVSMVFNESGLMNLEYDVDPALLAQHQSIKKKDFEGYKKHQRQTQEFNIEDFEYADDEKQEELDQYETQSYVNEIQKEIDLIQNEIDNQHEKQSKLDKVQETFKRLKDFCAEQLGYSFRDANKQVEKLLKKKFQDVSPLLKFYNELAANTNFKMPLRSLLEFDAKVFMRHLNKL